MNMNSVNLQLLAYSYIVQSSCRAGAAAAITLRTTSATCTAARGWLIHLAVCCRPPQPALGAPSEAAARRSDSIEGLSFPSAAALAGLHARLDAVRVVLGAMRIQSQPAHLACPGVHA